MSVSLGALDEPDAVHDGPDPTNEDTCEEGLAVGVAECVASEFLSAAAPCGPPGAVSWGQDVHDQKNVSPALGHYNDGGFAAAVTNFGSSGHFRIVLIIKQD